MSTQTWELSNVIVWLLFVTLSDWLILGQFSPVMPISRLKQTKKKNKTKQNQKNSINNLLTSNIQALLAGRISNLDLAVSSGQYSKVSVWDFPVKTSLSVNKHKLFYRANYTVAQK